MRYHALACDYDGTLAQHGRVSAETLDALGRLRASGRHLLLVTGRQLDDLQAVFPQLDLFERIVAENGALLYRPASREEKLLTEPPSAAFVQRLQERGVAPLSVGRGIVATWRPHEVAVLQCIRDLGLELHVIFNKDAVMVLPSGVNKATGLRVALEEMSLSPHNVVGVGDAENDHAFLALCECSVAVANALQPLKESADLVTARDHGAGVVELIEQILADDLRAVEGALVRHHIVIGTRPDGSEVRLPPHGVTVMIAGTSGAGKSTLATAIVERLAEEKYQCCVIDLEGDYPAFDGAVLLGDRHHAPSVREIQELLEHPEHNGVFNLAGLALEHRPQFFESLLPRLQEIRARTGHPHWIAVDEAHHLLPAYWDAAARLLPQELHGMLFVTVHPEYVSPVVLASVQVVIAVGRSPGCTLAAFSDTLGEPAPVLPPGDLEPGEAIAWFRGSGVPPFRFRAEPPHTEHRRHHLK